nr:integrase, catalytic region, zinc finger, CCHC-type, peptidase aspartic, catalytic [Tanacetum cinerariifolium]
MRVEGWDTWDREQEHMVLLGEGVGTVPVWWGCTGRVYGRDGFLAGTFVKGYRLGGQDNTFDDDVDEQPVQDLALNVDNVFQAEDCDAFNSDVDKALTAQTMFMANLSSADPITDEAGPSYDSDILS